MSAAPSLASVHALPLPDVQAEAPAVPIALDEAGISDLRYPVTVALADGSRHHTVASVSLAASVAADVRGVHMSRFVELLHDWHDRLSASALPALLREMRDHLHAHSATASISFPLFLDRAAPVTGGVSYVPYDCTMTGRVADGDAMCTLSARVPVKSLCPCSREISDYGAHNQRGTVEIDVELAGSVASTPLDFRDIIDAAEAAGSARIYSVLKRPDERFVTMQAYENPAFVEDITRDVANQLRHDERVLKGRVRVVNEESIHSHNAYASVAWG